MEESSVEYLPNGNAFWKSPASVSFAAERSCVIKILLELWNIFPCNRAAACNVIDYRPLKFYANKFRGRMRIDHLRISSEFLCRWWSQQVSCRKEAICACGNNGTSDLFSNRTKLLRINWISRIRNERTQKYNEGFDLETYCYLH